MSAAVEVLPEARQDILAGREFFNECSDGLGEEFAAEVLVSLDRIAWMPEAYGEVDLGVRATSVKRFGYVVYYRLVSTGVEILAVLHGARDPDEWQRRVY